MNQSGRVSIISVLGLLSILLVGALLFMSRESITSIGGRFMVALAKKDVDTLTQLSYLGKRSPEEIRKKWDFSVNSAAKYYNFKYRITSAREANDTNASVSMQVTRDAESPASYEEKYELPLIKVNNEWKIDVANISRSMYPGLPR